MMRVLRRALRTLRETGQRRTQAGVVLVYHRIADVSVDPWSVCVSPAHLAEHLEILARYTRPLQPGDLVQRVAGGADSEHAVGVTFDDGYADLLLAARPLLERAGVPATMFIATGAIDSSEEFWWDAVERALLHDRPLPPRLRLPLGGAHREWSLAGASSVAPPSAGRPWRAWDPPPTRRHALYLAVWQALLGLTTADRRHAVAELLAWAGLGASARPSHRTLREQELIALADGELIEIGAHTVAHPVLASMTPAEQHGEVAGSRLMLRSMLGRDVRTFAFPFGKPEHVGADATATVRSAGFTAAFLNVHGTVTAGTDPFAVPRVFVDDIDGEAFGRLLWRTAGIRIG
jgi:peptidoglycan/xylan/chitin deacetylase (PgdA/CDA1 family)